MAETDFDRDLYAELRRLAANLLKHENAGFVLQPTALVHEAFLKIQASYPHLLKQVDKRQFYACAAKAMPRILIDVARKEKAKKRGGNALRIEFPVSEIANPKTAAELTALAEAVECLGKHDPESAELVNLHFFVGMTLQQVAEVMEISLRTAQRHWRYAKAWLFKFISENK